MSEAAKPSSLHPDPHRIDSMGKIDVPADRYYGAQTARSLIHFAIGKDVMPPELIRAFGILKKAAALVNQDLGKPPAEKAKLIAEAADEVSLENSTITSLFASGKPAAARRHMKVNEVISNRPSNSPAAKWAAKNPSIPTTTSTCRNPPRHLSRRDAQSPRLGNRAPASPAIKSLRDALDVKAKEFATSSRSAVRISRTPARSLSQNFPAT